MCVIKIVLAFSVLLTATNARPEGYGVKGVKGSSRATANAGASAHAFGNTAPGGLGIAQSYATASADASAGGTANAASEATANAFADGENIGKAISSASAFANANHPIERSDVLDRPSDREKDTEYKAGNHRDGTSSCDQHIANAGHDEFVNNENPTSGSIGLTNSATVCHPGDSNCRNSKNDHSVSKPHPTYNENPGLTSGSSQPLPDRDQVGWGGNTANPGSPCANGSSKCPTGHFPNPDRTYAGHVEFPANSEKPAHEPSLLKPQLTKEGYPDSSAVSTQPAPNLNSGWGGNAAHSEPRPCTYGSPQCAESNPHVSNPDQSHHQHAELPAGIKGRPVTKPVVSNPYPSYNEHPDLSTGSSQPLPKPGSGLGGSTGNPGSSPCAFGAQKCSGGQPNIPHPNQPHDKHVELTTDSAKPVTKPSVPKPYPPYNEHPDLSAGSSQPLPKPGSNWGGNTGNPGSSPCAFGDKKCLGGQTDIPHPNQPHDKHVELTTDSAKPVTKPSVSNPYPSYNEHPDLSTGSSQPLPKPGSGWGGSTGNPGSSPCAFGDRKCLGGQPDIPHPNQPHDKHVELTTDSAKPGTRPSVSKPYPPYNEHPDLSAGSSQPLPKPGSNWGGSTGNPGSSPCAFGDQKCSEGQPNIPHPNQPHDKHVELTTDSEKPVTKPSVPKPYPPYNEHPDLSAGSSQPLPKPGSGWGGNIAKPESFPCTSGDRKCSRGQTDIPHPNQPHDKHVESTTDSEKPMNTPSVSNPYPSYNEHPDLTAGSSQPLPNLDGGYGGHKSIIPTGGKDDVQGGYQHIPFNKNPEVPSGSSYPSGNFNNDCGGNSATTGSRPCTSGSSGNKPGTSNPFLNGEIDVSEIQKAVKSDSSSYESSGTKPNPLNPFLNPHSQHPTSSTGGSHSLGNPNYSNKAGPSTQYPESKPNPLNPFLNGHSPHSRIPTGSTHHSESPNNSDQPFDKNPESNPNPLNPFLNGHSQHASTPTGNTHPESKSNPSNSFLDPHNQHPSPSTAGKDRFENQNGSDELGPSNHYPNGQQNPLNPISTHRGSDEVEACSYGSCKHTGLNAGNDGVNSDADEIGNKKTPGRPRDGVKTYRPSVKGHSAHRSQGSPSIKDHGSGRGDEASADGNASWDAYSKAHASASANAGGNGSAHAKSQAYSSANASGWSNSWASSSASASASASSSSWH